MSINKTDVVSTLIYGVQWDSALQFIAKTDADYPTNGTGKGNFDADSGHLATGIYSVNNIYDMAGNIYEWTMEVAKIRSGDYTEYRARVYRGGAFSRDGRQWSAGWRSEMWPYLEYGVDAGIGFRVALYLK